MRQAPLEDRSITELRAMAQAMDAKFSFSDDKTAMISIIRDCMASKVPKPRTPDDLRPADQRFIITPPKYVCTQSDVLDILQPFIKQGLQVTFPTVDQWHIKFDKREDSGSMMIPPLAVMRCAKELMR